MEKISIVDLIIHKIKCSSVVYCTSNIANARE